LPAQLWRVNAAALLSGNDFCVSAGELFLALLPDASPATGKEITTTVGQAAGEEGFRESRTGEPLRNPGLQLGHPRHRAVPHRALLRRPWAFTLDNSTQWVVSAGIGLSPHVTG
jgi:hypothetical protein